MVGRECAASTGDKEWKCPLEIQMERSRMLESKLNY